MPCFLLLIWNKSDAKNKLIVICNLSEHVFWQQLWCKIFNVWNSMRYIYDSIWKWKWSLYSFNKEYAVSKGHIPPKKVPLIAVLWRMIKERQFVPIIVAHLHSLKASKEYQTIRHHRIREFCVHEYFSPLYVHVYCCPLYVHAYVCPLYLNVSAKAGWWPLRESRGSWRG